MSGLDMRGLFIELQGNEIKRLEAQLKELKYTASLSRKNNKKGKRKAPKVEKRCMLIICPIKKQGK